MPRRRRESADGDANSQRTPARAGNGTGNGFEAQLFLAADMFRKDSKAAELEAQPVRGR